MSDELNQKISQLLDNELDPGQALLLLQKMRTQPELQDKMKRYEAINHALKTDVFVAAQSDFSARIHQQIQQEPSYLLPRRKPFKRTRNLMALAASIAIVAVIAERTMNTVPAPLKVESTFQIAQQQPEPAGEYPLNKRINDYLQAHNSSVYTSGEANSLPFARVTSYSRQ
jgi:sigma-E factor negative regulatory protein RseA